MLRDASYAVLAVGVLLRLANYFANRSFSIDEDLLSLNLIRKSAAELLGKLGGDQAAPIGFLELEKLAEFLGGRSEFAFRFLPLLFSLLALGLFYVVSRRVLPPLPALAALAFFAFFDPVIYYAAITKPYELDVLVTVLLYAVFLLVENRSPSLGRLAALAGIGSLVVWFSYASTFVLAPIGALLAIRELKARRWRKLGAVGAATAAWLLSLAFELSLAGSNVAAIQQSFERRHGVLLTTGTNASGSWFAEWTARLRYLVGVEHATTGLPIPNTPIWVNQTLTVFLMTLAVVGAGSLLIRRPRIALLLTLPVVLVLFASALHRYPLVGRTLLFLFPSIALCLGESLTAFARLPQHTVARMATCLCGAVAICAITLLPAYHLVHPRLNEEMKPALAYLGQHYRSGDSLYVSDGARFGLAYYHLCGCAPFDPAKIWRFSIGSKRLIVPRSRSLFVARAHTFGEVVRLQDLRNVAGRGRVWFLLSAVAEDSVQRTVQRLETLGQLLDVYKGHGVSGHASLLLFDLRGGNRR